MPEISRDEIGQLADALEHFRQQALEVQRLNLVERLYGELQDANAELQRMQARLVAQEKLAALGELVSGVAHEISNPLNFVKTSRRVRSTFTRSCPRCWKAIATSYLMGTPRCWMS